MAKVIIGITKNTADLLQIYLGSNWGTILEKGEDGLFNVKLSQYCVLRAYDDCVYIILGDRRYWLAKEDFVRIEIA